MKKILTKMARNYFEYSLYCKSEGWASRGWLGSIYCKKGQWYIDIKRNRDLPGWWSVDTLWGRKVPSFAMGYKMLTKGVELIESQAATA